MVEDEPGPWIRTEEAERVGLGAQEFEEGWRGRREARCGAHSNHRPAEYAAASGSRFIGIGVVTSLREVEFGMAGELAKREWASRRLGL